MPDPVVVDVSFDIDTKSVVREASRFEREMRKHFKSMTKAGDVMGAANEKATKKASRDVAALADAYDEASTRVTNLTLTLEALQHKAEKATGKEAEAIKEEIKDTEKLIKKRTKAVEALDFDPKKIGQELKASLEQAGSGLKSSLSSFFAKDAKGLISNLGSIFNRKIGKGLVEGVQVKGAAIGRAGAGMARRGAAMPGMGGKALKTIGTLMGKLGPVISGFAKVLPLLGTVATAIVGVVKLFLDAEAHVKDFNRDLLESASTVEFLHGNMWKAGAAAADLESTITDIRLASQEWGYLNTWGIMREDHVKILNILTQEGVTLRRMSQEAEMAGRNVGKYTQELAKVTMAYSKAFGVPLQEIGQFQAELMTEMGMGLESTRLAFAKMTRSATESGIASNKFFAMIRGVSQDLSLYNVRLGETVKILEKLGKAMSPRNAQKFLQTAVKGLKEMGRSERLKLTMLAGAGEVTKIVDRDIKRKTDILARELKMDSAEVANILQTKGARGLAKAIGENVPKEARGAITEMATKMQLQMTRRKKGVFGVAGAAADVGPGAALEITERAIARFTGGKNLEDAVGEMGTEMVAEMLNISQAELDQRIQFKMSMDMERERMTALLEKQAEGQELSADEIERLKMLEKAGLTDANKINRAGYDQIFDGMLESDKGALKQAKTIEDFAEKQVELTDSMLKTLERLLNFVMAQLYEVIWGIWEALPLGDRDAKLRAKMERDLLMTGNKELQAVIENTQGKSAAEIKKALMATKAVEAMTMDTSKLEVKLEELKKKLGEAPPSEKKGIETQIRQTEVQIKEAELQRQAFRDATAKWAKENQSAYFHANNEILKEMKISRKVGWRGMTAEQQKEYTKKMLERMDPTSIGKAVADASERKEEAAGVVVFEEGAARIQKAIEMAKAGKPEEEIVKVLEGSADISGETAEVTAEGMAAMQNLYQDASTDKTLYVQFSSGFLRGSYKKTVHDAFLDALRVALFEQFLYSEMTPEEALRKMRESGGPKGFAQAAGAGEFVKRTLGAGAVSGPVPLPTGGRQHGGLVTGVRGGMAIVPPPPPGEGYTTVGRGEEIVPAYGRGGGGGGGPQTVLVTLNPDARRMFQAEVRNGIYEHERRRRLG